VLQKKAEILKKNVSGDLLNQRMVPLAPSLPIDAFLEDKTQRDIEAAEKGRKGFTTARGGAEQGMVAAGDGQPAAELRHRRATKVCREPILHRQAKAFQAPWHPLTSSAV
jgi:hypothetical protein